MATKWFAVALFICLGVLPLAADADLISVDWQSAGDNLITQDTDTNLEWLDLTVTMGLTGTQVLDDFSGWRYATLSEINSLFGAAGAVGPYNGWSRDNYNLAMPLIDLWGQTDELVRETGTAWSSYAIFDLSADGGMVAAVQHATPGFNFLSSSGDWFNSVGSNPDLDLNFEFSGSKYGHALVRNISPVPEPATLLLFCTSLAGLAVTRIRRKNMKENIE